MNQRSFMRAFLYRRTIKMTESDGIGVDLPERHVEDFGPFCCSPLLSRCVVNKGMNLSQYCTIVAQSARHVIR